MAIMDEILKCIAVLLNKTEKYIWFTSLVKALDI